MNSTEWNELIAEAQECAEGLDRSEFTGSAEIMRDLVIALNQSDAERMRLVEERDDAQSMLSAWFDLSNRLEEEIGPVLLDALRGYLRTSRVGGMSQKDSDLVENTITDFYRLYLGQTLVPFFRDSLK